MDDLGSRNVGPTVGCDPELPDHGIFPELP